MGSGLTWSGGIFVKPVITRIKSVKLITFTGTAIMSLSLFLASYCSSLWQLFLTQALLYGIGSSLSYFPIMSIAPTYFDRHRGFTMGCILSGAGAGGLVMAPVLQVFLDRYGIRGALRILAAWNFAVGAATRDSTPPLMERALGAFLQAAGNVIPLYYMTSYSVSVLSYSRSGGSLLLAINSSVNSVSRIAMGWQAEYFDWWMFALWYDAARERFIAYMGSRTNSRVNGFIYFVRGLGSLLGAPIAGLILGSHKRGGGVPSELADQLRAWYEHVVVYDGLLLFGAVMCVVNVRWLDARDKGGWKWKA
ncbi:major facilitator superfamily domain-containing protein [Mycena epipterygia]|nr:major facilitator superfamily domain-containing protein [Mycena epipterygia]